MTRTLTGVGLVLMAIPIVIFVAVNAEAVDGSDAIVVGALILIAAGSVLSGIVLL